MTVAQAVQEIENWLQLATLFHDPIKEALLAILHNDDNDPSYSGLPRSPVAINAFFKGNQNKIKNLSKKGVLKKDQVDLLLPKNSNQTDSKSFDVTLIIVIIIEFTTLPPPKNGWKKSPPSNDNSIAAFVLRAREWRNRL